MRKLFFKSMLLLCALIVGTSSVWGTTYEKVTNTSQLIAGDEYIIVYEHASKAAACGAISTTSTKYGLSISISISNSEIEITEEAVVPFILGGETGAWTFQNSENNYYLTWSSGNSLNQKATATSDSEKWNITITDGTTNINNKGTGTRYIRYNNTSGQLRFACYENTQQHISLYKKKEIVVTALDVKTSPTKLNYKVGESLDLTGLVLDATIGGNHEDITSGYTASPANGATLNSVGAQTITFTYGGQTCNQTIHVGSLQSIAITTAPTKTTYDEGQSFDPMGMVVKATFSDGEDTPAVWEETLGGEDYTYSPSAALTPSNTSITISYTWNEVNKTANQTITVTAGVPYRVSFDAGSGSCATSYIDEASFGAGVVLPSATIGFSGWSFAGWATTSTTNTEIAPTLYAAGETYHPTDNCTLYAVYSFTAASATTYKRATSLSDITSASSVVIVCNNQSKVLDNTLNSGVSAPTETSSKITASAKDIFTLTGDNTDGYTLTNNLTTVGATSTDNSTVISNTTSNDLWVVKAHNTSNTFYFENKAKSNLCLEYYNNSGYKWLVYAPNTPSTNAAIAMKVYVPLEVTVYNSNPAAIINPIVTFTTSGDKSLYVQGEASYTNVANVTGIAKTPEYTSSDATVATVSEEGEVTALKSGSTTITAKVAAEIGVNTEASATYIVTVKDAKTIAGIKAITSTATAKSFTADLTDAVVTYVNGDHAYIQDESGAIYASCGSSLTAGKKINGAVTGSVKAANQIDEITAIDLNEATITDGVIPSAATISAATLAANKTDYEGKLVRIENATVTASLSSGSASGGKISDDGKTTEINLYAPDSNIDALKDAEGTFNGYISLFSGSTIRFNIYEQTQITLTKNAPTSQPLAFTSDEIVLDEETAAFEAFTPQAVSGAVGTVSYAITGDAIYSGFNATTGEFSLNGVCGTATITTTAAAKEVTEAGVTTPYTETEKSYTVTVRPRYSVVFHINDAAVELREESFGAGIIVPTPLVVPGYSFIGWRTSALATTDTDPDDYVAFDATFHPEDYDDEYYAVYAVTNGSPEVKHTSTFTIKQSSAPDSPFISDGSSWTWSNLTFTSEAGACINSSNGSITFTLPSGGKATALTITKTSNAWAGAAQVVLKDASSNSLHTFSLGTSSSDTYNFTSNYDHASSYTLTNTTSKNAWVDHIDFKYTTGGISYSGYTTTIPGITLSLAADTWATYCFPIDVVIPDDARLKVYKSEVNAEEDALNVTAITGNLKAGEGVLMKANTTADDYTFSRYTGGDATPLDGNALKGCVVATHTDVLKAQNSGCTYIMVLDKTTGNFGTFSGTFPGGKAYLPFTPSTSAPSAFRIVEVENSATGINNYDANDNVVKFFENGQLFIKKNGITYDTLGRIVK